MEENSMENSGLDQQIQAVRRFNRFYTKQIGVLQQGLLDSPYSLTEARIIYELAQHESSTATELGNELGIDPGYLSRILGNFQKNGLIHKETSREDGRQSILRLSQSGQQAFALLNARSQQEIQSMLEQLTREEQSRLVQAMYRIEELLGAPPEDKVPYILRPPQPGDLGWVVARHGALYAQEYQWDETFEGFVAEIIAAYVKNFDPKKERCWIAEVAGENAGSVFIVKKTDETAKLRMLLVDPRARGLGIGKRLVQECIRFARQSGYRKITLWTNSILLAARAIYRQTGFQLVESEAYHGFGQDLVGETWELEL
jgi:DNA-binding MarR family transcriptional regulator/predicted GNAT family acetyltransferase